MLHGPVISLIYGGLSTILRAVDCCAVKCYGGRRCQLRLRLFALALGSAALTLAAALIVPPATTCIVSDCSIVIICVLAEWRSAGLVRL